MLSLRSSVPALQVHLRLVGPAVGSGVRAVREQLDTCESGGPSVHFTVECERGLFPSPGHFPGPGLKNGVVEWRPHLVLAFNAGICAYETWLDALRYCCVRLIYTIFLYSNYDSTEVVLCAHRPSAFRSTRATSRERHAIARSPLSHALRHPLRDSRLSVFRSVRRARIRSVRLCGGTSRNSMKRLLLKMHSYSIWCFNFKSIL